ncbi:MAG: ABC transporter permease [Nitrospirae bacterium]|nr:MAG: ABC transporter permease [Nitrospirota bacterium]
MRVRRIWAVVLRQLYLYRRSLPRLLEVFYWPMVDLLLWGFVSLYLQRASADIPSFVIYFLGALILWDILFRAQQGISVSFLEDMWARNLINIFASPLKIGEYILGLVFISILKVCIAFLVMSTLAWLFYSFSIFKLGIALIPLVLNLMAMGWAVGIFTMALILRFGQEAEVLAWAVAFLFMPFSAVFYPVSTLPLLLQRIAYLIPSAHVFEGMRILINDKTLSLAHLSAATLLNLLFLSASTIFFIRIYQLVKKKGILPKIGE